MIDDEEIIDEIDIHPIYVYLYLDARSNFNDFDDIKSTTLILKDHFKRETIRADIFYLIANNESLDRNRISFEKRLIMKYL